MLIISRRKIFPRSTSTAQASQRGIPNKYHLALQCRLVATHSAPLSNLLRMAPATKSTLWEALKLTNQDMLEEAQPLNPSGFSRSQALSGSNCRLSQRLQLRTPGRGSHRNVTQLENTTSSTMAGRTPGVTTAPSSAKGRQTLHSCSISTHQHGQKSLYRTMESTKFLLRLLSILAASKLSDPLKHGISAPRVKTNRLVVNPEAQQRKPHPMAGATQLLKR